MPDQQQPGSDSICRLCHKCGPTALAHGWHGAGSRLGSRKFLKAREGPAVPRYSPGTRWDFWVTLSEPLGRLLPSAAAAAASCSPTCSGCLAQLSPTTQISTWLCVLAPRGLARCSFSCTGQLQAAGFCCQEQCQQQVPGPSYSEQPGPQASEHNVVLMPPLLEVSSDSKYTGTVSEWPSWVGWPLRNLQG